MTDIAVSVPKHRWKSWLVEGDRAGELETGATYGFRIPKFPLLAEEGDRVYIVCGNKLRGYAPLVDIIPDGPNWLLIRGGHAVAVTIDEPIRSFQSFHYRTWDRRDEKPFPTWETL